MSNIVNFTNESKPNMLELLSTKQEQINKARAEKDFSLATLVMRNLELTEKAKNHADHRQIYDNITFYMIGYTSQLVQITHSNADGIFKMVLECLGKAMRTLQVMYDGKITGNDYLESLVWIKKEIKRELCHLEKF